jgi:multiple sugar transport system permease protein
VMLPLVRPGLVSAGLMSFIFAWNAFTFPLLLGGDLQTSTVAILSYISSVTVNYGQVAAAATISILPSVVLALFVQKHLVRGLSFGAVKG